MCVQPIPFIRSDGTTDYVPCRACWSCRQTRVTDFAGRCYAEARTSAGVSVLTLTYAGDVPGSVFLLMADVQRLWKRLRSAGYPLRYIVAGEHGSRHGRAHWHCVIFWQKKMPPDIPPDTGFQPWSFWPHGHVHSGRFDFAWLRYQLKYMLKNTDQDVSVYRLAMSKKPPLGRDYFYSLADEMVDKKTLPKSLVYSFPECLHKGRPRKFFLGGRMGELFLDRVSISWRLRWGEQVPNDLWLCETYLDKIARREIENGIISRAFGGFPCKPPSEVGATPEPTSGGSPSVLPPDWDF